MCIFFGFPSFLKLSNDILIKQIQLPFIIINILFTQKMGKGDNRNESESWGNHDIEIGNTPDTNGSGVGGIIGLIFAAAAFIGMLFAKGK